MKKLMLLSLVLLVSLSSFAQDLLSKIPKDAVFVSVLKGNEMLKHVSEKELLQYHFTNDFFKEIDNVGSFEELGVDLNQNFYYFISLTDSISYNCFLMPLKSANKLPSLLGKNNGIKQYGSYTGTGTSYEFALWDESSVLFIFPFGISKETPSYGMMDIEEMVEEEDVRDEVVEIEESSPWDFDEYDVLEKVVVAFEDEANLAAGKDVFERNCTACHLKDGGGLVGPNHTDEYWLHGGSPSQIFHTIAYGVSSKGMISWKSVLSPREIQQVMSYVRSLEGTTPKSPKAPQGEKYDRSTESNEMQNATIEEQVEFIMKDSKLTGYDRIEYKKGLAYFLKSNYQMETLEEEEEVVVEEIEAPRVEIREVPKNPTENLLKAFAIRIMSNKSKMNSMANNPAYLAKVNKKAVATAWSNNYGEIYRRMLGLNDLPHYGYPRGAMGTMMTALQRMNSSDISGVKSITANLFLAADNAEVEVLAELTDDVANFSRQMSNRKFNKDFFRYFDGDKVMGYWGMAVNIENTIDLYPKMVSSMLQNIMPEQKEEAALGAEFLSIVLDAEEIGELFNGDLMFVVSDVVEKEVKYMSYEYDDDFNATKVEKTKMEPIPEFLFMMSTEKPEFFRKFLAIGKKYKIIDQTQKNLYKIETKKSRFPVELYVVLKDGIFFLASSEYQARDIANGIKGKISRKHRKKAKRKNMIFYANNDAIIDAVPKGFLSPDDVVRLDFFHTNFRDMEFSTSKIKGNVTKTNIRINTNGAELNALESFFGMFDEFFIDLK